MPKAFLTVAISLKSNRVETDRSASFMKSTAVPETYVLRQPIHDFVAPKTSPVRRSSRWISTL